MSHYNQHMTSCHPIPGTPVCSVAHSVTSSIEGLHNCNICGRMRPSIQPRGHGDPNGCFSLVELIGWFQQTLTGSDKSNPFTFLIFVSQFIFLSQLNSTLH